MPPGLLARYPALKATASPDPAERTRLNVRDSDATLILVDHRGTAVSAGTELARDLAGRLGRPALVVDLADPDAAQRLAAWLAAVRPAVLGIGGPRESEAPGIYDKARRLLRAVLAGGS